MVSNRNYNSLLILPGAVLSGLFVYFILSYLLMPGRISIPISIMTSALILGLTMYYNVPKEENNFGQSKVQKSKKETFESKLHNIIFMIAYAVLLAVLIHSYSIGTSGIFVDWEKIGSVQGLYLAAAIAFSFFLPGYALVTVLDKKYKLRLLLKLLLAYLFSMLITGLGGYVSGSFGYAISNTTIYFIGSYILIFLFYLQQVNAFRKEFYTVTTYSQSLSKTWRTLLNNYSQVIVFSSLFALVILYTYYLNDGKIVVDEWYQHGRALLIGSGLFKDLAPSDPYLPPFFSSLLAAFFNLSGTPSVNAYVSISFLNIVPVVAFYYFFTSWIPRDKQRAALLASTLFMLSAGFGWIYLINAAVDPHHHITSDVSVLNIISQTFRKTFDIETPTTFINVGHPDVTTPLIIITLPAGFTLLGLIKEVKLFNLRDEENSSAIPRSRYLRILTYLAIVTSISFLGILSHDEFYLFIIIASTAMVVLFRLLPIKLNYSIFFVSFLLSISLVILVDKFVSPTSYYIYRHIFGTYIIILSFLFVSISWTLYATFRKIKFSDFFNYYRLKRQARINSHQARLKGLFTFNFLTDYQIRFLKLSLGVVAVAAVAYFYIFTLLVWNSLSVNDVSSQIKEFSNVPWYLYPIKFGLPGLLGLAFILSYLFKKFEKEIFIFGIIIIIAFFAGPYYDEHRFGKYIMAGMAAFTALLLYKIISSRRMRLNLKLRPFVVGILFGIVVTSSCLSIFIYAGWVELFTGKSAWIEGGRRDFPTTSELQLLNFLNRKIIDSKAYNIAMPEKDISNEIGFATKIYGFSPTSRVKLLESPLTLNSSTMEGLYNLLNQTDVRFIILPKKDIIADTENKMISYFSNHNYNSNISNVMRFVLDNFPRAYEDQNYMILEVLPFTAPATDNSTVSFVYQRDFADMTPHVSTDILPIDHGMFGSQTVNDTKKNNSSYQNDIVIDGSKEENKNLSSNYILTLGNKLSNNDSKIMTLWSQPVRQIQQSDAMNNSENNRTNINYIEGNFKIIDQLPARDKSEKKNADKFGAGIVWEYGNNTYLASISNVGLQLLQIQSNIVSLIKQPEQPNNTKYIKQALTDLTLSQNEEVKRQKGLWYNLKILLLENNLEIYLDDILRIKVPVKENYNISSGENNITDSISRVGINSYYSKSEFQPLIIGQIPNMTDYSYPRYQKIYYQHYYPLSSLALSETRYDAYIDGDMSAFSKKYVVLPFDKEPYQKNEASKYLEYVSKGGNLIVINSNNKFDGIFAKLFSIKPGNLTKYTGIEANNSNRTSEKNTLTVSGITRSLEFYPNSNLTVKSYYIDKRSDSNLSQNVAPFAIERDYGKGKITYVNAIGYFDSIFGKYSPSSNIPSIKAPFVTLSKFAPLMGLPNDLPNENPYIKKNTPHIILPSLPRIIGDIRISSGQNVIINSSSLVFPNSNNSSKTPASYNLSADDVSILAGKSQHISLTNYGLINNNITSQIPSIDNSYYFKKGLIKDLELFGGPFEIIINVTNSTRPIYLPTSLSYNDYIAMSIPKGFDMSVKFSDSNSTYAQLDVIKENDKNSFQRIKVSGYNNSSDDSDSTGQILFHNVRSDIKSIRYLSALMKSPEIKIIHEDKSKEIRNPDGEQPNSLKYRKDSPDSTPIEIQRGIGDITMRIDHVDNYIENYLSWTRTKFITYLENDIQIRDKDNNIISQSKEQSLFTKLMSKMPGDISEYAKDHGIEVPWRDVIRSTPSIILSLVVIAMAGSVITLAWFKIKKSHR